MIDSALRRLRALLRPPDPRTPGEIERDLSDELAFHLDGLEREARADGADARTARAEARRRFGNPDRIRAACRGIAMQERIMLQRIHTVLTIVLLVAVVALGAQLLFAQRSNARTLERLDASMSSLADMRAQAGDAGVDRPMSPLVYLDGDVARPGSYELPASELSLRRLLAAAGGSPRDADTVVTVYRDGARAMQVTWGAGDVDDAKDPAIEPGDLVVVRSERSEADPPASASAAGGRLQSPGRIRIIAPARAPRASGIDGGSMELGRAIVRAGGLMLTEAHLPAARVHATVRRPRGDGTHEEIAASWSATEEPPREPRLVAGDVLTLTFEPVSPPESLPDAEVLELSLDGLRSTVHLLEKAVAAAPEREQAGTWPPGTAARLEADLRAAGTRLRARGEPWSLVQALKDAATPPGVAPPDGVVVSGDVRSPRDVGIGNARSTSLSGAIVSAGGLAVPRHYASAMHVKATIRRPMGDGSEEILTATWKADEAPPSDPALYVADALEIELVPVGPPEALPTERLLGLNSSELHQSADFIQASILRAREREPRGAWPEGSTARLEADLAALVSRIKVMGGAWPRDRNG